MSKLLSTTVCLSRTILKSRVWMMVLFLFFSIFLTFCRSSEGVHDPSREKDKSLYKAFLDKTISPEKIDLYLRCFTSEPHVASSPRNNDLAKFVHDEWKKMGLDDVHLVPYDVLLSFPEDISVELVSPSHLKLSLKEDSCEEDPDTKRQDVGIPYNAYSRSGDITAPLIYANSGNPQDYDYLEMKGLDLEGKIALVRYSAPYSYRGFKAFTAEKRGLAALLIYSDPKEDGSERGPVFPVGPWGPMSHIQRGGIPYDFIYPGDPLTPGWPSRPGCERISQDEARVLPRIISVPISAQDALPLFKAMDGEEAPQDWRGALPVTYRLGGEQAKIHMNVKMREPVVRIFNVIGYLKGTENTDEIVMVGNHRDAWIFGGHDPSSGTACLMELVRAFAKAKRVGYQPKRTIVFANWDAEEFTLTGSTEWGEDNRERLKKNLVAYLNVDSSAAGKNFSIQAVPCLFPLILRILQEVKDPATENTVYECWKSGPSEKRTLSLSSGSGEIEAIGSGTDHAVFLNHIGAPALDMTFSGDYGVYHSMYDNYYWMSHFGDPGMLYTAALAKIWGYMVIELASSPLLPLDYETYAQEIMRHLECWADHHDPSKKKSQNLFRLIRDMEKSAISLTPYVTGIKAIREQVSEERVRRANQLLIDIERDFTDPEGIPGREWYKHLVYGARYTYDVLLFPALTEAAESGDERGIEQAIRQLERSVRTASEKLKKIASLIDAESFFLD